MSVLRPRSPRTENRFRERELARAVKAAKAAGGERVEVDPASGRITVIIGKGGATTDMSVAAVKQWDDATEAIVKSKKGKSAPTRR
jgi:glycerate-2-kinase